MVHLRPTLHLPPLPLRALPSIAVLLSGHFRDTLESAVTTAPLQRFLAQCDRSSSHYALFVHTWNRTEPVTTTYYKAARRAAASVDVTRLAQLLQPAGLKIEHQTIASSAMHEKWALSGMTVAGIKAAQPERLAKMANPDALAQRKARLKATLNSEEYKAKRAQWDTPEYRKKLSDNKKAYWAGKRADT